MDPVPSEQYPVIDSVQSNFDRLLASLPDLVGRATEVVDRASRVLSDDNIMAFSKTMQNIEKSFGHAARRHARRGGRRWRISRPRSSTCVSRRPARAQLMDTSGPDLAAASERIPQDLRKPRQHHGEPGPTHDRSS